jgi:hypothetical protein
VANFKGLLDELKRERDLVGKRLEAMNAAIVAFAGVYSNGAAKPARTMSAAARERIAAAQRARWAKARGAKVQAGSAKPKLAKAPRSLSAAAKSKIAAAQRARWAKVRAARKTP